MGGADARAGDLFGHARSGAEDAEKSAGHEAQGGRLAAPLLLPSPLVLSYPGSACPCSGPNITQLEQPTPQYPWFILLVV